MKIIDTSYTMKKENEPPVSVAAKWESGNPMTREEIVKALRCYSFAYSKCPTIDCNESCPYWMDDDEFNIDGIGAEISTEEELCRAAADMLEQDVPIWISVKERLPEPNERVLAYFPEMRDSEADIQLSKGWAVNKFVSHWMPLPKPPKKNGGIK